MVETKLSYNPDFAVHPGETLRDEIDFLKMADMNFAYTYPIWDKPYPEADMTPDVKRTKLSVFVDKPFYPLLQAFNWAHYRSKDPKKGTYRLPTKEELRFMAYFGIVMGSKGVFFFSFQTLPDDKDYLQEVVVPIIKELKQIRLFFLYCLEMILHIKMPLTLILTSKNS